MATLLAILLRLLNRLFLTTLGVVSLDFAGGLDHGWPSHSAVTSTIPLLHCDANGTTAAKNSSLYISRSTNGKITNTEQILSFALRYPFRFYLILSKMADNLRRAAQDIDLGVDDKPVTLSAAVVAQASTENRFILMGRPVIPRRQNIRSIVASMPRVWGHAGLVHGRIVPGNQFQFIFPFEESLETVIRRGPWAFNDRMLVLQKWSSSANFNLNIIPFWIQIRGIPFHFLSREVIGEIGRAIGNVEEIDYDPETAARVEFVRVQINWNVEQPLRFHRNFQFQAGVNTLLKFRYERLRGFCEACGLLTHDSGAYLITNGGPDSDSEGDDDDNMPDAENPNSGVVIRELNEDKVNGGPEIVPIVASPDEGTGPVEDIDPMHNFLVSMMISRIISLSACLTVSMTSIPA